MKEHLNAIILAVAFLLAVVIYCYSNRYQIVGGGEMAAYEVDRITGETWWHHGQLKMKTSREAKPR